MQLLGEENPQDFFVKICKTPDTTVKEEIVRNRANFIVESLFNAKNDSKYKNKTASEILYESAYCTMNHDSCIIFNRRFDVVTPGEILRGSYGLRNNAYECPLCKQAINIDSLMAHLENGIRDGHHLTAHEVMHLFRYGVFNK